MLQILFSEQSINTQYEFAVIPVISSPEYKGVSGVSSGSIPYNSGCLQYTGLPSCNHWCVCRDDPGTLCLLTCDYCYVCDSEPKLPSGENVNFEITDITSDSMRIQFIDADPDLPPTLLFLTRLGDYYANISSLASDAAYTYHSLSPNTAYEIEVTAVLDHGVLSKSWTLTATTLTESSDHKVPVVVGCVVSVTVVVALLIVIGILLKRRKAKQSHEETPQELQEAVEPYDYIDESSMRQSTEISGNMYLTPVVTPSDGDSVVGVTPSGGYEPLYTYTRENNQLYVNENREYTSMDNTTD